MNRTAQAIGNKLVQVEEKVDEIQGALVDAKKDLELRLTTLSQQISERDWITVCGCCGLGLCARPTNTRL